MNEDHINYEKIMDDALRNVVRKVLDKISIDGLTGAHHLYITFNTKFPGVEVPSYLAEEFPDELTIVIQHQFWALKVEEDYFSIVLSFNKNRETVSVPFAALTRFADPGVKFGLQFNNNDNTVDENDFSSTKADVDPAQEILSENVGKPNLDNEEIDRNKSTSADQIVVSLDAFRKK